jgi:hypothetical protein
VWLLEGQAKSAGCQTGSPGNETQKKKDQTGRPTGETQKNPTPAGNLDLGRKQK